MQTKWILAIDPSIRRLGWALFLKRGRGKLLVESGVLQASREKRTSDSWENAVDKMVDKIRELITSFCEERARKDLIVLIEMCQVFPGGRGGAASGTGSILKLGCFTYALRQMLKSEFDLEVVLIGVRQWKGTVPKRVTIFRAEKHWGWEGKDHNEADAIGLGSWWLRK